MLIRVGHIAFTERGGAGIAMSRIVDALSTSAVSDNSGYAFKCDQNSVFEVISTHKRKTLREHFFRLWLSLAKKGGLKSPESLSCACWGTLEQLPWQLLDKEIIHFHWMGANCVDYERLSKHWPSGISLVWTLHDLNPISAACHYWADEADAWSLAAEYKWFNPLFGPRLLKRSLNAKRHFFETVPIHLVVTSDWMMKVVLASELGQLAESVTKIAYPLRLPEGGPIPRKDARMSLGLNPSRACIALGAANVDNPRKGFDLAESLMANSDFGDYQWLLFGAGKQRAMSKNVIHYGQVDDPDHLRNIYAAADLFLLPSREEAFGQTGIEALSEGTPVMSFANTGPADYTIQGKTGLSIAEMSSEALRLALPRFFVPGNDLLDQKIVYKNFQTLWQASFSKGVCQAGYDSLYGKIISNDFSC